MESRDLHVRVLLLQHLGSFISLCNHDDQVGVVLPEVLVGLNDTSDKMVQATLHGLAELVPYVGAELVMGTSRKKIFTDAQPRVRTCVYMCVCVREKVHVCLCEEGVGKTRQVPVSCTALVGSFTLSVQSSIADESSSCYNCILTS